MIPKLRTNFSRYTDSGVAEKTQRIIDSMNDNPNYPAPVPALTDVQSLVDSYNNALANLGRTGQQGTLIKNQLRDSLEELLRTLALYVQVQGGSNLAILQSSGYDLQKGRGGPIGILPKPSDFKVIPGPVPGSAKPSFEPIDGANTYLFQYADASVTDSTVWQSEYSGKSSHIIEGLTSGNRYAFRVCGIGTDPTRVFSDVIISFVL